MEPDGAIDRSQVLEEAQALASLVGLVFVAAIVSLLLTIIGAAIPELGMVVMALGYVIVAIGSGIVLVHYCSGNVAVRSVTSVLDGLVGKSHTIA